MMLRKEFRTILVAALLVLISVSPVRALEPQDALSARPQAALCLTARMNDLGSVLKSVFSPSNVEAMAALGGGEEIALIAGIAAQLPAKSAAITAGMGEEGPFLQLAASLPEEAKERLALVAAGKASSEDLAVLLFGEGGAMFAEMLAPELQQGAGSHYALLGGMALLAAKDDLLLLAASPLDLEASLKALDDAEARLSIERRFESPNYCLIHADMATVAAFAGDAESEETKALLSQFKAPLKMELAFDAKPESFLVSCWFNALESFVAADDWKDMEAAPGGGLFLTGGGSPFFAFASPIVQNAERLKELPEFEAIWGEALASLEALGITEEEIASLLAGTLSIVAGGEASFMGQGVPGFYAALEGKDGAAAKILRKLTESEGFTAALALAPVEAEGWDLLFATGPEAVPATVLAGVKGETLFVGLSDPAKLNEAPKHAPAAESFLGEKFVAGGFFDTASFWSYLRGEVAKPDSLLGGMIASDPSLSSISDLLGAELAVTFVKLWASGAETSFMELTTAEVPLEKALLPRLASAINALNGGEGESGEEQ